MVELGQGAWWRAAFGCSLRARRGASALSAWLLMNMLLLLTVSVLLLLLLLMLRVGLLHLLLLRSLMHGPLLLLLILRMLWMETRRALRLLLESLLRWGASILIETATRDLPLLILTTLGGQTWRGRSSVGKRLLHRPARREGRSASLKVRDEARARVGEVR